jgi:hypothetical protein
VSPNLPNVLFELALWPGAILLLLVAGGVVLWVVRARRPDAGPPSRGLVAGLALLAAAMGWGLFAVTAIHEPSMYLGPIGIVELQQMDGFDPWTGAPHGRVYVSDGGLAGMVGDPPRTLVHEAAPASIAGRRAIPVWVGFGATLAIGWVVLVGRRGRARIPAGA